MDFFFVPTRGMEAQCDLRDAMRRPEMRRVLRRVLSASNYAGMSKSTTDDQTAFNEGMRAIGFWLAKELESAEAGAVATLMNESAKDLEAYKIKERSEKNG
jgi:hypothetical protein